MNRLFIGAALVVGLFCLKADGDSSAPAGAQWSRGKDLFEKKCAICHAMGVGSDKTAASLHVAPAKLNLSQSRASAKQIESLVRKGHSKMPAAGYLSDAEMKALIQYVQSLRPVTNTAKAVD